MRKKDIKSKSSNVIKQAFSGRKCWTILIFIRVLTKPQDFRLTLVLMWQSRLYDQVRPYVLENKNKNYFLCSSNTIKRLHSVIFLLDWLYYCFIHDMMKYLKKKLSFKIILFLNNAPGHNKILDAWEWTCWNAVPAPKYIITVTLDQGIM